MFKLLEKSSFGKLNEPLEWQTRVAYTKDEKVEDRALWRADLADLREVYEQESRKPKIMINRPFQIGLTVYQLAKLRMLAFYNDFLHWYFDHHDFELILMDMDSN